MSDWLLVRMSRYGSRPMGWVRTDATGRPVELSSATDLQGLAAAAVTARRVLLIAPPDDVLQLAAALPAGNAQRLAQVAPFALEDQLAEDIEGLHFALGKPRAGPGNTTDVDVVSRERLDAWLAAARAAGLDPAGVYSLAGLVPTLPGQVTMLAEDDQLIVRREGQRPVVLPAADPVAALEMVLSAEPALDGLLVTVYADAEAWPRWQAAFEIWRPRLHALHVQLLVQGVLPWLAAQGLGNPGINLLQGEYAPRRKLGETWLRWRVAALLAGLLLTVHLTGELLAQKRLRSQERVLDAAIQQTFAQAMPGELSGGRPRQRLEQRVARLVAVTPGRDGFLPLTVELVAASRGMPGLQWQALDFTPGKLEATLRVSEAASAERVAQALRAGGHAVRSTAGPLQDKVQEFRIELRSAAQ